MRTQLCSLLAEIAVQIDQNVNFVFSNGRQRGCVPKPSYLDIRVDRGGDAAANFAAIISSIVDGINFKS